MNEYINYIKTNKSNDQLKKEFINDFIMFRKENNLTQELLALYSKTSRVKISRIENRMHSPTIDSLIDILGPLGYTIKIQKINKNNK